MLFVIKTNKIWNTLWHFDPKFMIKSVKASV